MNFEEIMKSGEQQKTFSSMEIKKVDNENKTIEVVMSSNSVDRHGEIVLQSGMTIPKTTKSLTVFVDHDHTIEKTVGKVDVKTIETKGNKTSGTIQFATEISPLSDLTFKLMKEGYITDVSIGFIPQEYDKKKVKAEDGTEKEVWRWTKWEIIELSVVGIGSNRDAFKKAFKDGKIDEAELKLLGVEEKSPEEDKSLERAVQIFEKNHGVTKCYRKTFEKLRKLLNIDPEDNEEDTINKTFNFISDILKDSGLGETHQKNQEDAKKEVRTISQSELDDMLKGL